MVRLALGAIAAACVTHFAVAQGARVCAGCHRSVWETYQRTGMGRSFSRPSPENTIEDYTKNNTYYHAPSDSYFTMLQRDGKYFQRRFQIDSSGKQINVMEKQVDYIMGSGNHARTYLQPNERQYADRTAAGMVRREGRLLGDEPGLRSAEP